MVASVGQQSAAPARGTRAGAGAVVIGVDPGLTRCGVGVVAGPAHRPTLVEASCITTSLDDPIELRLLRLRDELQAIVARVGASALAVERVLFSGNARTAMPTGQAAGIALLVAADHGLPVVAYSPNEVKQTVAGDGRADKQAVARLVAAQLRLDTPPRPVDVTDALAVAITHLAHARGAAPTGVATPARAAMEAAAAEARRSGRGGWAAVAASRGPRPGAAA
jgi:crossover junction endodeoxyribonuclease RuvC